MISEAEKSLLRVGYKQTLKAIKQGNVKKVFIAADAEDRLIETIKSALENSNTEIVDIESMHELGKLCGIDIGASCAAVLS